MTIDLLKKIGFSISDNIISISQKDKINSIEMTVEPDWSSASYFYSIVSLAEIRIFFRIIRISKTIVFRVIKE